MSGYDVTSTFSVIDNMTPVLNSVISSMGSMLDNMDMLNSTSKDMIDVTSLKVARSALEDAKITLGAIRPATDDNEEGQRRHNKSIKDGTNIADGLLGKIEAMAITYGGIKGITKVFDMSDELAESQARLNLVKDSTMSIAGAQEMVFQSAMRARQPYQQQLDMVSKLQLQAKSAFKSTGETVAFAEQLGKRFKIAGTDAQGIESVMYNLTQAMSTGVLRGQDLNAIMANAPSIVQDTAKYLGYTEDKVKKLAEDGMLSAQAVKNAILASANETDEAFRKIPMTFGDIVTMAKNDITMKLRPALESLNNTFNTEEFQTSITIITDLVGQVAFAFAELVGVGVQVFSGLAEHMDIVVPILGVAVGALVAYKVATLAAAGAELVKAMTTNIMFLGIVGVVGALVLGTKLFNHFMGTSVSALGVVTGAFATVGAFIWNGVLGIWEFISSIIENLVNSFIVFSEFLANVFRDPIGAIIKMFANMAVGVLNIIKGIAGAIDAVFGSNLADAVVGLQDNLNAKANEIVGDEYIHKERFEMPTYDRIAYSDAWSKGYGLGAELEDKLTNFDMNIFSPGQYEDQNIKDIIAGIDGSGLAGDVKDGSKKELDISNAQLEFIRSIAERRNLEQLNIDKIEVKYENQFGDIHETADLDGFFDGILDDTEDAIKYGIGGVLDEA